MKKIIKIIITIGAFLIGTSTGVAKENYIKLGESIPNIRLHLKTPTIEKNKNMYQIINTDTNELVYCIEPGIMLYDGIYEENEYQPDSDSLTEQDWYYLTKLAYYGYGYQNRTEIKWYVTTQFLIWEYLLKDTGEVYFINNNNEKIDLLKEEQKEILNDVKKHDELPSFAKKDNFDIDYTIKLTEELELKDTNQILDQFNITSANHIEIKKASNKIKLSFNDIADNVIYFDRKEEPNLDTPKIYYHANSQKVMSRGKTKVVSGLLHIYVNHPTLTIKKNTNRKSDLSLAGAEYSIFYEDGTHYGTITLNEKGEGTWKEMWPGKYYLVETKAPYGYELNKEKIVLEIKREDVVLEVEDKKIEKKVTIEKYAELNSGKINLEENAEFEIYNSKKEKVKTLITDKYGKASTYLPYDTYEIIQVKGKEGYSLADEIKIAIDENYEEKESLIIRNKEIVGKLKINKIDSLTKEPIANVLIGLYDNKKNLIKEEYTDKEGKIILENLPIGTYWIKELKASDNYELKEEEYKIEVKEGIEVIFTLSNRMKIKVPKTGVQEFSIGFFISIAILLVGVYLCNDEKK